MATVQIEPTGLALEQTTATFSARLDGLTPLLMHKPSAMQAQSDEIKRSNQKNIPTPEEEATAGAYRFSESGLLYLPAVSIQRAMVEAGKAYQDPNRKRATMSRVMAGALVPPEVEGFTLLDPESGETISEYEIDIRRAVVNNGRSAVMRARPRIDAWMCPIQMQVDLEGVGGSAANGGDPTEALQEVGKTLLMILAHAGRRIGVLDNRPEKSGPFGRFTVADFVISDDDEQQTA